ncbi:hypothetical protein HAX54_049174, partial [Datura stramonium]|nr:hypothetical protein [Datura stramonium]
SQQLENSNDLQTGKKFHHSPHQVQFKPNVGHTTSLELEPHSSLVDALKGAMCSRTR